MGFCIGCRFWSLSVLSVVILTTCNILLTVRLLHSSSDCPQTAVLPEPPVIQSLSIEHQPPLLQQQQNTPLQQCGTSLPPLIIITRYNSSNLNINLQLTRWDNKRLYKYYDWVIIGSHFIELSEKYSVTLSTQSSLDRLYSLVQVAHQWTGPISTAIFISSQDELIIIKIYLKFLIRCYQPIKERVSFHIAMPKESPSFTSTLTSNDIYNEKLECLKPEASLRKLLRYKKSESIRWRLKLPYPQNHMRNLARKNSQTSYVFVTDVDIIPSSKLAIRLDSFLKIHPKKYCQNLLCAYVIPTYELDERVRFPQNKSDLVRLAKKGLARPFHQKVFIYNQFATNFSRWQSEVEVENEDVHISHNVTNFEFLYEPFYVAPDTVPPHDERFIGYGYTRNTQVYETFVAGYQFQVLSPIFTVHWGLQNKKSRPGWRERQNSLNRRHFEVFKREVFARYQRDPLRILSPRKHAELKG